MKSISFSVNEKYHKKLSDQSKRRGLKNPSGLVRYATYQFCPPDDDGDSEFITVEVSREVAELLKIINAKKGFDNSNICTKFALHQLITRSHLEVSPAVQHELLGGKNVKG